MKMKETHCKKALFLVNSVHDTAEMNLFMMGKQKTPRQAADKSVARMVHIINLIR